MDRTGFGKQVKAGRGSGRYSTRRPTHVGILLAATALLIAGQAVAEPPAPQGGQEARTDSRWFPWLGCWTLVNEGVDYEETQLESRRLVCLTPRPDGQGVAVSALQGDQVTFEQTLLADGVQHPVDENGCRGWQANNWSEDGHRLFVRGDMVCEGDVGRAFSGVSMMVSRGTWVDIQLVRANGQQELVVRRYRLAGARAAVEAGIEGLPADQALAASTARVAIAEALSLEDVVEATREVDPEVVEAALLESNASFEIDAGSLIYLADAGVPEGIIDLVVALSYPDYFVVERGDEEDRGGYGGYSGPVYGGYWPYAYGFSYFYTPFGYPYRYGYYPRYYYGPRRSITRGRVVKGRGYTQVRARSDSGHTSSGSFLSRILGGGGRGSSKGGAAARGGSSSRGAKPKGSTSKGGSSRRRAKPRGQ